jgi:hypothetical protein
MSPQDLAPSESVINWFPDPLLRIADRIRRKYLWIHNIATSSCDSFCTTGCGSISLNTVPDPACPKKLDTDSETRNAAPCKNNVKFYILGLTSTGEFNKLSPNCKRLRNILNYLKRKNRNRMRLLCSRKLRRYSRYGTLHLYKRQITCFW